MFLLVCGNAVAMISDVFIKEFAHQVSVPQFVLLRTLITIVFLLPFLKLSHSDGLMTGWKVLLLRAQVSVFGIICMVVSLKYLSLASANAVFYTAPIMVSLMAAIFYREKLTPVSVTSVFLGFIGVLLILRPTSVELASLSALGVAVSQAVAIVLVKKLPKEKSPIESLFVMHLFMVPALLLLSLFVWQQITLGALVGALGSSIFIVCYNLAVLFAYRMAEANKIASSEYTGMLWAILAGWLFFSEVPDLWVLLGSGLIICPLVWLAYIDRSTKKAIELKQLHGVAGD
ncbi:DMT family transporter [Reinekea thalattae]|nr:DMT family transporter [Reinekea thalattae]